MPRRRASEPAFALNWQRKPRAADRLGNYNFEGASVTPDLLTLTLGDNSSLASGNFVYVVHTPGEPFAIGRIMEFMDNNVEGTVTQKYAVKLNWLYRPSSIHKKAQNSRELLLTMHSEVCSLDSLRGRVVVTSKPEITDLDGYMAQPNHFWFDRFWDRYIAKFYDVVPCAQISNIPPELGPLLRRRFTHVIVEPNMTRTLLEAPKFCEKCDMWCSEQDSVHCCNCDMFFHRCCTEPPIPQCYKGYSWSCGPCSAAHEAKLEAQRGPDWTMRRKRSPLSAEKQLEKEKKEAYRLEQEEEASKRLEKEHEEFRATFVPRYKEYEEAIELANRDDEEKQAIQKLLWPFRYLGMNATTREIFDVDDRIQPRAISRVGPKNQANVQSWPGRPVEYYRKLVGDQPRKRNKSRGGSAGAASSTQVLGYEPEGLDHSLPWVQEAPPGYTERGNAATSTLLWTPDAPISASAPEFLARAKKYAEVIHVDPTSCNFIDACLSELLTSKNEERALQAIGALDKKALKEPDLDPEQTLRFEEAVGMFGNDLHKVYQHVKTKSSADIVRFYYLWKKTPNGHLVWDNCQARASRQKPLQSNTDFLASIASEQDQMLVYSSDALKAQEKVAQCEFCDTSSSKEWRKAPNVIVDPADTTVPALCLRCSRLWYRYAAMWIDPETVIAQAKCRTKAAQLEPELVEDAQSILAERRKFIDKLDTQREGKREATTPRRRAKRAKKDVSMSDSDAKSESGGEVEEEVYGDAESKPVKHDLIKHEPRDPKEPKHEPIKQEPKHEHEHKADSDHEHSEEFNSETPQSESDSDVENHMDSSNYCMVCSQYDPTYPHLTCQICLLSVHAACYGFVGKLGPGREWHCDCCLNDKDNQADVLYQCDLCPVILPNYAAWLAGEQTQVPDALKRTWDSVWAHVRCAVWTPGVRFEQPECLQQVEVYEGPPKQLCSICSNMGQCVACFECGDVFHPGCAGSVGHAMGFVFTPAEDGLCSWHNVQGTLRPEIVCSRHFDTGADTVLIPMSEMDEPSNRTALQIYVSTYKDAGHRHLARKLRQAMINPQRQPFVRLVVPIEIMEGGDVDENLHCLRDEPKACSTCHETAAAYWVRSGTVDVCCGCYWKAKRPHQVPDEELILSKLHVLFDAEVPASSLQVKTPPARSMRIKDILS